MCVYMQMYPFGCMHAESPICVCVYGITHLGVRMQKDTSGCVHMDVTYLLYCAQYLFNNFTLFLHLSMCVNTSAHVHAEAHMWG